MGTVLDPAYRDATLELTAAVALPGAHKMTLDFRLSDPDNHAVPLHPAAMSFTAAKTEARLEIPVPAPKKWDAEHPNLYTLEATLRVDGVAAETLEKKIGFRKIEVRGNKLYVNGQEVKLRGACRHDIHPLRGRSTTPELDDQDARLYRDANMNFVRTSHYPPSEKFLEACDRYGVYVEEETAVCFVNPDWMGASPGSQSNPAFHSRYMAQFSEMIARDRSHPAVLLWSLGNEGRWGAKNIAAEYAYVKREDPSRPVIFSYPGTVPAGTPGYDVWSEHYPKVDGDLKSATVPKLNDERIDFVVARSAQFDCNPVDQEPTAAYLDFPKAHVAFDSFERLAVLLKFQSQSIEMRLLGAPLQGILDTGDDLPGRLAWVEGSQRNVRYGMLDRFAVGVLKHDFSAVQRPCSSRDCRPSRPASTRHLDSLSRSVATCRLRI